MAAQLWIAVDEVGKRLSLAHVRAGRTAAEDDERSRERAQ